MKLFVVAVRDRAADVFGVPQFVASIGGAIRSFGDQVRAEDKNNPLNQHPEDFDLFKIGSYDDATASFELLERPEQIAIGKDYSVK